jgi:hypothetical protein
MVTQVKIISGYDHHISSIEKNINKFIEGLENKGIPYEIIRIVHQKTFTGSNIHHTYTIVYKQYRETEKSETIHDITDKY